MAAYLFNSYTTVHDHAGVAGDLFFIPVNVNADFGTHKYGRYLELTTVALNNRWISGVTGDGKTGWLPDRNVTVSLCYEKTDSTNRASTAFSISYGLSGINYACHAAVPYSDGVVYWQFGGTAALAAAGLSFGADHWVFTTGPRGREIWQNGALKSSDSTDATRSVDNTMPLVIGGTDAAFFNSDLARYSNLCLWNRQLTASEIELLCANPYSPWEAPSALGQWAISSAAATQPAAAAPAQVRGGWHRTQFVPHTGMIIPRPVGVV